MLQWLINILQNDKQRMFKKRIEKEIETYGKVNGIWTLRSIQHGDAEEDYQIYLIKSKGRGFSKHFLVKEFVCNYEDYFNLRIGAGIKSPWNKDYIIQCIEVSPLCINEDPVEDLCRVKLEIKDIITIVRESKIELYSFERYLKQREKELEMIDEESLIEKDICIKDIKEVESLIQMLSKTINECY